MIKAMTHRWVKGWINHPVADYPAAAVLLAAALVVRAAGVHPLKHLALPGRGLR
jgi:hypothetical protein